MRIRASKAGGQPYLQRPGCPKGGQSVVAQRGNRPALRGQGLLAPLLLCWGQIALGTNLKRMMLTVLKIAAMTGLILMLLVIGRAVPLLRRPRLRLKEAAASA